MTGSPLFAFWRQGEQRYATGCCRGWANRKAQPTVTDTNHTPPPITGYRQLTPRELFTINALKAKEREVAELLKQVAEQPGTDLECLTLARQNSMQMFMWATHAIARPDHAYGPSYTTFARPAPAWEGDGD